MNDLSFHEAIRSGDVAARLIYADWLEDRGRDEEAALLRSERWRLVPAGTFWMGGGGGKAGERQVEIPSAFYLGAYPVTQAEWQAVMGNNPSWFSRGGDGKDAVKDIPDADLKQFPVEQVSWDDVQEYLKRLNAKEKDSGWTYRLPTSAEWEYACRGGATSEDASKYRFYFAEPTDALSSDRANFDGNFPDAPKGKYLARTTKAGSYPPNRLGIYDMHGNVFEWTSDLYDGGPARVIRGGSWFHFEYFCRASFMHRNAPSLRCDYLGFRVVGECRL